MVIVIVKYFFPFSLTEKTDTINATSEISKPNTEKAPGTKLGARANNANAIASQPATMLISMTVTYCRQAAGRLHQWFHSVVAIDAWHAVSPRTPVLLWPSSEATTSSMERLKICGESMGSRKYGVKGKYGVRSCNKTNPKLIFTHNKTLKIVGVRPSNQANASLQDLTPWFLPWFLRSTALPSYLRPMNSCAMLAASI